MAIRFILIGPGRAGLALALAMSAAGHRATGVMARREEAAAAAASALDAAALAWDEPLPPAELVIIAVRDDAIAAVAAHTAPLGGDIAAAVHLSGLKPVGLLEPWSRRGVMVGSFHPLQTLPDAALGAARLAGAWIGVTAGDERLVGLLEGIARSIGARPFSLADAAKPVYHAGAAAAANLPLAALTMASDLFAAAGVPFDAARPLVEAVVANAFDLGPAAALTGPVARGDTGTVAAQLAAVAEVAPEWLEAFSAGVAELARLTGREPEFRDVIT